MAATKTVAKEIQQTPWPVSMTKFSALVAALNETFSHGGYAKARVMTVRHVVTVPPTSNDPVLFSWLKASDDTTNGTVTVRFDTVPGGDLTGCEVEVYVDFYDMKGGGFGTSVTGLLTPILS